MSSADRPRPDHSPVDAGVIVRVGAVLVLVVAVVVGAMLWWHHGAFDRPTRPTPGGVEPGMPALQVAPGRDRQAFDRDKAALLNGYGWVDRAHGVVRIPIDEAMRRLSAQRRNGGAAR